jgi:glycosyltransferase involved in cell wall biosynthesis
VVVVDDGSSDDTVAVVQRLMQQYLSNTGDETPKCQVRLIENPHRGKGFTVRSGMLQGCGEFILFSDADLCTPISETNKLLFWLDQGFDIAIGSREGIGARRYGEPFYRHLMGRVFNLIVRVVTNSPFQDTQCGFKAFTRAAAYDLFQRVQLYGENSPQIQGAMVTGFDVEVLFLALKYNYRVKEVPVEWYHVAGSKVSPVKDSLRMLRDIASVRLNDIKGLYRK